MLYYCRARVQCHPSGLFDRNDLFGRGIPAYAGKFPVPCPANPPEWRRDPACTEPTGPSHFQQPIRLSSLSHLLGGHIDLFGRGIPAFAGKFPVP